MMDAMPVMPLAYISQATEWLFLLVVGIVPTIFWVAMLVDALRRDFRDASMKLIWVLVLIFTHFLGALIYFFAGRSMGVIRR